MQKSKKKIDCSAFFAFFFASASEIFCSVSELKEKSCRSVNFDFVSLHRYWGVTVAVLTICASCTPLSTMPFSKITLTMPCVKTVLTMPNGLSVICDTLPASSLDHTKALAKKIAKVKACLLQYGTTRRSWCLAGCARAKEMNAFLVSSGKSKEVQQRVI